MIKQISHFKLARNLLVAGPHLGIGSYRRFPITQRKSIAEQVSNFSNGRSFRNGAPYVTWERFSKQHVLFMDRLSEVQKDTVKYHGAIESLRSSSERLEGQIEKVNTRLSKELEKLDVKIEKLDKKIGEKLNGRAQ